MYPSDKQLAEIKAKHPGQLHLLEFDDGRSAVVVKRPPKAEWDRLQISVNSDRANGSRAVENFARACIVWPSPPELDAIIEERPALMSKFGEELSDLAGASEKIRAKKL